MTAPNPFEYTDDSVVARLSVDIPNQAVTDISQLTTAMSAMRTELEAISRAQSDWLSYLQQMPVIVEQSNQALRNQITLMERMSYLQAEIGTSGGGGGGGGIGGGQGGGDGSGQGTGTGRVVGDGNAGSSGGYSTAAPAGFRDDFQGMPGTGREVVGSAAGNGDEQMTQDPRALANMAASRGIPINLGMLGALGGIATGMLGRGNDPAGSQSPQQGNASRTAGGSPKAEGRGEPEGSQDQDEPGEPGENAAPWEYFKQQIRDNIKNEKGERASTKDIRNAILKKVGGKMFKGGPAKMGVGTLLKGGGLMVGGAVLAHQIQNIGEDITEYQQLGSVRGGDYLTGMGMELENRVRALDPFVNLGQTRSAMQAAYSNGFMGDSVREVQSQAIANFKELGMSMQETARMMAAAMYGKDRTNSGETLEEKTRLDAVVRTMKELSSKGGLSATERREALGQALSALVPMGMSSENVEKGELVAQEAFGNIRGLGETIGNTNKGIMNNKNALAIVGQRVGITGITPSAMPNALSEAGYTPTDVTTELAKEVAQNVAGIEPRLNRIGTFMDLMNQMGAELTFEAAEGLYDSVSDGKDPTKDAKDKLAHPKGKESKITRIAKNIGGFISNATNNVTDYLFKDTPDRIWRQSQEMVGIDPDAQKTAEMFQPQGRDSSEANPPSEDKPVTMGMSFFPTKSEGTVSGNVTITVDRNGNVTAPPSIQLTGTQSSSQYGYGSAQMNNPPPGEGHSRPPLTGGN